MNLEKVIAGSLGILPLGIYQRVRRFLISHNREWLVGRCDLYRCAHNKMGNPATGRRVCHIRKGLYDYQYFNICFVNNVLSLIVEAIAQGMVPRVEIINDKGDNIWETFFMQPFADVDTSSFEDVECECECGKCFPAFDEIFRDREISLWGALYNKFVRLNEKAASYVDEEIDKILEKDKSLLGVLCRGTDYTGTKPKGHPVQPELDEVMNLVERKMREQNYDAIYLATEDGRIDKMFRQRFPGKIRINKRQYYDAIFGECNLSLIKDVHFDREDDDYLKGIEYLSSLIILSECDGIIAGNCGGSQMAVFLNAGYYSYRHVYDLGLYQ